MLLQNMGSDYHLSEKEGFSLFGIDWAPLNISFERRAQTFFVFLWFFSVGFGICFNVVLMYYILKTTAWPIVILYLWWMYYDWGAGDRGGRRFKWLRRLRVWKHFRDYFPIRLIKTADLPANRNYLFCAYPHGVLASGPVCNFATDANDFHKLYPGLDPHLLTLSLNFNLPISRETILGLGGCSCTKESIVNILNTEEPCGQVAVLVVGGAAESVKALPGSYRIVIRNRKGFVKVALEVGADMVPVFSFGENDIYGQFTNPTIEKLQDLVRKVIGFAPLILRGRGFFQYTFGLVPHRRPINTVVGKSISVPKIENPTQEDVDKYHEIFRNELGKLFNEYKAQYDSRGDDAELIME